MLAETVAAVHGTVAAGDEQDAVMVLADNAPVHEVLRVSDRIVFKGWEGGARGRAAGAWVGAGGGIDKLTGNFWLRQPGFNQGGELMWEQRVLLWGVRLRGGSV